jgi:CO/xanthine dehydrogenase FAD-binding subunit
MIQVLATHPLPTRWARPGSVDRALALTESGATPVAGATAIMSTAFAMTLGAVAVDLAGVLPAGVDGNILGAGTTLAALAGDPAVGRQWPAVAAAAALTANPNVRQSATLGGTVAARLPTADLPAALAAHGAVVLVARHRLGVADVPLAHYLSTDGLGAHLVVGVRLTRPGAGAYRRFALMEGPAPALATVAGVRADDGGLHLWAGAVGPDAAPLPLREGTLPRLDGLRSDRRASARYRLRLLAVLADEVRTDLDASRP